MSYSHRTSNMVVVGISSRASEKDLQWLMDFIRETFWEIVSHVKYLPITNSNKTEWESKVRGCSVGILYHTKRQGRINIVNVDGALYDDELQTLFDTLGKDKVLVVLDDMENCSDSERQRILDAQPSLKHLASQVLLFPEKLKNEEGNKKIGEFLNVLGNNDPRANTTNSKGSWASYLPFGFSRFTHPRSRKTSSKENKLQNKTEPFRRVIPSGLIIGIFSRSTESHYEWLMELMKTWHWRRPVDVRAVLITNTPTTFHSALTKCSFAVLYHTQRQGRVNVTDVTDALYDKELQDISRTLGKENVIVVIDDLQNTDTAEKNRILERQPSIQTLAKDLFLFNERKKNMEDLENIKKILMKKAEDDERMEIDYPASKKTSQTSSNSANHLDRGSYQDSSAGNEPTSTWSPLTLYSKEPDIPGAHILSYDDSEEPDRKKMVLEPDMPNLHKPKAHVKEDGTFQDAFLRSKNITTENEKLQNCMKRKEIEFREMRQEILSLQQEKEKIQCRNSDLLKKIRENEDIQKQRKEAHIKMIEEKDLTIEELHKDLSDRERIGRREQRGNDKRDGTKIQHQENYIHEMENKVEQERPGQNWKQERETEESQQYEERRPRSRQEDDKTNSGEHRNCTWDFKKGNVMGEGSLCDRTEWNTTNMYNQRQKSTDLQDLPSVNHLQHVIQQKDEEIQRLKTIIQQQQSELEERAALTPNQKY